MKKNLSLFLLAYSVLFISLAPLGCGSDGNNTTILSISPQGPTDLTLGNTLQFNANISGVTWSVVGGDENGTIDDSGLYTPPSVIPITNPQVTVMAEGGGQEDTALVNLFTGDTLSFRAPEQINESALPFGFFVPSLISGAVVTDRISVQLGSVQVDTILPGNNGGVPNLFYSQNLDFLGFSSPVNVASDAVNNTIPLSIETDEEENPGIIFSNDSSGVLRLFFIGSTDQGQSFGAPVPIAPDSSASNAQLAGYIRADDGDDLHLAFAEVDAVNSLINIFYTASSDSGATWSTPTNLSNAVDLGISNSFPSLAVSPDGNSLFICWNFSDGGNSAIHFSMSTDGGANFSAPTSITSTGSSAFCRIARGPDGAIYVAYREAIGPSQYNVLLLKSTDNGSTFGAPVTVNSATISASGPIALMGVDSLSRVDVVWSSDAEGTGSDTDSFLYARSTDAGATFSPQTLLAQAFGNLFVPTGLRHDDAGRLYLQYLQTDGVDANYFFLLGR